MYKPNFLNSKLLIMVVVSGFILTATFQNCSKYSTAANSEASSSGLNNSSFGSYWLSNAGEGGQELIKDNGLLSGANAKYACWQPDTDPSCATVASYALKNPYYSSAPESPWSLAQWGSKYSLPSQGSLAGDHHVFANAYKALKFFGDGRVELSLNALSELDGKYYEFDSVRKWPHLLLEQSVNNTNESLATMSELNFNLNVKLMHNNQNRAAGYNVDKHTSQFTVYFTVQNLNTASVGYGQYVWLGVPVFEERSEFPPAYMMVDEGTKSMIYTIAFSTFANVSVHSGELVNMKANILPFAKDAIVQAAAKGLVSSANLADYRIGGTNLGFEVTGLNTTTIQFSGFSLKAKATAAPAEVIVQPAPAPAPEPSPAAYIPDTPEGFYRINGGDGIFYSNGKNAYCVFTSWATYVKWGGEQSPLGSRATVPQNMRYDGACP